MFSKSSTFMGDIPWQTVKYQGLWPGIPDENHPNPFFCRRFQPISRPYPLLIG